jgi:hypothetical protein
MQKTFIPLINGGAILFTTKAVVNLLFVVENKTPDTLRLRSGQTKVGRYAFGGNKEHICEELFAQMGSFELLIYLGVRCAGHVIYELTARTFLFGSSSII